MLVLDWVATHLVNCQPRSASNPEWPAKSAMLRSQPDAKSLMLYEKRGARGIRTLDTA
jgi:hypothetical protein